MMGGDPLLSGFENSEEFDFETRAIRAGQPHDQRTGGVVTPIALATTFAQDGIGQPKHGYEYARTGNPTRHAYEACVASLEGAAHGFAFASGLAAEDAVLRLLEPGCGVLLGNDAYGGTFRLIDKVHGRAGVRTTAVDLTRPETIRESWDPRTKLVWLETPTNREYVSFHEQFNPINIYHNTADDAPNTPRHRLYGPFDMSAAHFVEDAIGTCFHNLATKVVLTSKPGPDTPVAAWVDKLRQISCLHFA